MDERKHTRVFITNFLCCLDVKLAFFLWKTKSRKVHSDTVEEQLQKEQQTNLCHEVMKHKDSAALDGQFLSCNIWGNIFQRWKNLDLFASAAARELARWGSCGWEQQTKRVGCRCSWERTFERCRYCAWFSVVFAYAIVSVPLILSLAFV